MKKNKWITIWSYAQRKTTFTRWENQNSFEIRFKNNIEGTKVRIRFSNWYGVHDTGIKSVYMLYEGRRYVTKCNNEERFRVFPDSDLTSDYIEIHVVPGTNIGVVVEFESFIRPDSGNTFDGCIAMILQSVDVYTDSKVSGVAFFGDSITHRRKWTEPLIDMWYEKYRGMIVAYEVSIDGSRLLKDSPKECDNTLGFSARARFSHDILKNNGITHIFFELGLNDLSLEDIDNTLSVDNLIKEMKEIVNMAHEHNIMVIGMTITPRREDHIYDYKRNNMRKKVNEIILNGHIFDKVIDISGLLGNEDDTQLSPEYGCEDGVHLNNKAGEFLSKYIYNNISEDILF